MFVFFRYFKRLYAFRDGVNELQLRRLQFHQGWNQSRYLKRHYAYNAYKVAHCFKFDTSRHASRRSWFLDTVLVGLSKEPNGVVRVAEHPEVIPAHVREFL